MCYIPYFWLTDIHKKWGEGRLAAWLRQLECLAPNTQVPSWIPTCEWAEPSRLRTTDQPGARLLWAALGDQQVARDQLAQLGRANAHNTSIGQWAASSSTRLRTAWLRVGGREKKSVERAGITSASILLLYV